MASSDTTCFLSFFFLFLPVCVQWEGWRETRERIPLPSQLTSTHLAVSREIASVSFGKGDLAQPQVKEDFVRAVTSGPGWVSQDEAEIGKCTLDRDSICVVATTTWHIWENHRTRPTFWRNYSPFFTLPSSCHKPSLFAHPLHYVKNYTRRCSVNTGWHTNEWFMTSLSYSNLLLLEYPFSLSQSAFHQDLAGDPPS